MPRSVARSFDHGAWQPGATSRKNRSLASWGLTRGASHCGQKVVIGTADRGAVRERPRSVSHERSHELRVQPERPVDPIVAEAPGRTGLAGRGFVRALLATGVVVAGIGVMFATSASAAAPRTASPATPAAPDTTEPAEGTVTEPIVIAIIPPAAPEPAETVPAPVIRSEAIARPAAAVAATPQAQTQSFVPRASAAASTTKALPRLPETGSTTGPLVVGGVGLVGLGVVALACGRRTRTA